MVIRESSRLLHQATDGRAYIRTVSVVLPAGWGVDVSSMCKRNVSRTRLESYSESDVKISAAPHPLFTGGADALWTQQSRDCGQMGDYISTGPDFFFQPTTSIQNGSDIWIRGRRFLREFAKYRYGVFDLNERGRAEHDGIFPDFFCAPSASAATNATGRSIQSARYVFSTSNILSNLCFFFLLNSEHFYRSGCDFSSNENCINGTANNSAASGTTVSLANKTRHTPTSFSFLLPALSFWFKTVVL